MLNEMYQFLLFGTFVDEVFCKDNFIFMNFLYVRFFSKAFSRFLPEVVRFRQIIIPTF